MRVFFFSSLLVLSCLDLCYGQLHRKVWWTTTTGTLDSALMASHLGSIKNIQDLSLYTRASTFGPLVPAAVDKDEIQYLYSGRDTLVRPYQENSSSHLLLLLHKGEVSLYRSLSTPGSTEYYLHYQGIYYPVPRDQIAETGQRIINSGCRHYKPYRRLRSDVLAIDFTEQLNRCLNGTTGRTIYGHGAARWRFGLAISDVARVQNNGAIGYNGRQYAAQMPRWSLIADWAPIRSVPWLKLEMQSRFLNVNWEEAIVSPDLITALGQEGLQLTNLYFLLGPKFEVGIRNRFQLLVGGGLSSGFPLRFNRWVLFDDPQQTLPGFPVHQTLRGSQTISVGYYACMGVQMRLWRGISLGINIREEYLEHKNAYANLDNIVYTERFPRHVGIVPADIGQAQLYLVYSW